MSHCLTKKNSCTAIFNWSRKKRVERRSEHTFLWPLTWEEAWILSSSVRRFVILWSLYYGRCIEISFLKAPKTCYNFLMLVRQGKYDQCPFHRLIPGVMV